jgi:catechol 2,3-dioxygenase-like lactoylglutathione lyase family enzyme
MFRHVGIVVNNLDTMLFFYSEVLGMEIISNEIEEGLFLNKILGYDNIIGRIIKLGKDKKTIVELLDFNKKEDNHNKTLIKNGFSHFAITVSDVNELYKKLIQNNFFVVSEPQISVNKKFKVCFCRDPEENFVEIVEIL